MYRTSGLYIFVKGKSKSTDLKVNDGQWHHVCVTWSSNGGNWMYYDNGAPYTSGSGLQSGKCITGGGSIMLGQEQDSVGGGLDPSQALLGRITGFNLWSRALSGDEVAEVFKDCSIGGDVFTWDLSDLTITGDVIRRSDRVCGELMILSIS
ncbi:neuronal pentraxin-1-like [Ptychodera flava]|uniref:neuronal pentraxin-1-like n=1 Tax=Ptychodera flava TaxID=63121 RepID=UPI003969D1E6